MLIGFENVLKRVETIYFQVNLIEMYRGMALFPDVNRWLCGRRFQMCALELTRAGWGDLLWIRSTLVLRIPKVRGAREEVGLSRRTKRGDGEVR